MNVVALLRRCEAIESGAGKIYRLLAERFAADAEISALFAELAADERTHAKKLATWREFLEHQEPDRHPFATGYEQSVRELEELLDRLRQRARAAATDEQALAIALELESSELDAIYTTLLQSSPLSRFPDLKETWKMEIGAHHEKLVRLVRARSRSEDNLLAAAILGTHE